MSDYDSVHTSDIEDYYETVDMEDERPMDEVEAEEEEGDTEEQGEDENKTSRYENVPNTPASIACSVIGSVNGSVHGSENGSVKRGRPRGVKEKEKRNKKGLGPKKRNLENKENENGNKSGKGGTSANKKQKRAAKGGGGGGGGGGGDGGGGGGDGVEEGEFDEEEDASTAKKERKRPGRKELLVTPNIGLGFDGFPCFDLDHRICPVEESAAYIKINDINFHEYETRREWEIKYAERLAYPICPNSDPNGSVLFTMIQAHPPTFLTTPMGKQISAVTIAQESSDVNFQRMYYGEDGGSAFLSECCLWYVSGNQDESLNKDLCATVELLGRVGSNPGQGDKNIYQNPAVTTKFTQPKLPKGPRLIHGFQMKVPSDTSENEKRVTRKTADEMNYSMLKKIVNWRKLANEKEEELDLNDTRFVPASRAIHEVSEEHGKDANETKNIDGCYQICISMQWFKWKNKDGQTEIVKLECCHIRATAPGTEVLVGIKQAINCTDSEENAGIKNILMHMRSTLANGKVDVGNFSARTFFDPQTKLSAPEVTSNAQIIPMLREYVHARGGTLNLGGLCVDFDDADTLHFMYKKRDMTVNQRIKYYSKISEYIEDDLAPNGPKYSGLPVDDEIITQYNFGSHYRKLTRDELEERILYTKNSLPEEMQYDYEYKAELWKKSLLHKNDIYYIKWGGEPLCFLGLFMKINLDFDPYVGRKYGKLQQVSTKFEQPANLFQLPSIYCRSKMLDDGDDLTVLISDEKMIPDLTWLLSNSDSVTGIVQDMAKAMKREVTTADIEELSKINSSIEIIKQLYGLKENPFQKELAHNVNSSQLKSVAKIWDQTMACGIRQTLSMMSTDVLQQYSAAVITYRDYKSIAINEQKGFQNEREKVTELFAAEEKRNGSSAVINSAQQTNLIELMERKVLALDLNIGNEMLLSEIFLGALAYYMYQMKAAWGTPISISDLGESVAILCINEKGILTVIIHGKKLPGGGADSVVGAYAQIIGGVKHIIVNVSLKDLYMSGVLSDKTKFYMSPMAMSMVNGSGVKVGADGKILLENQTWADFGTQIFLLEKGKHNQCSNASKEEESNIEKHLNDSGNAGDQKKNAWDTTVNGASTKVEQWMAIPVGACCSNKHPKLKPPSINAGARQRNFMTASMNEKGIWHFKTEDQKVDSAKGESQSLRKEKMKRSNQKIRAQIRQVGSEVVKNFPTLFAKKDAARRCYGFFHRTFTCEVQPLTYVLNTDTKTIDAQISELTMEVRKAYLDVDAQHRNMEGPWKKVAIQSQTFWQFIKLAFLDALMRPKEKIVSGRHMKIVDLQRTLYDVMKSNDTIPWSINTIIDSLYTHLGCYCMDPTIMILTCYQLCTMNFNSHCPAIVLALVVTHGYDALDALQKRQYDDFSSWVLSLFDSKSKTGYFVEDGYFLPKEGSKLKTWLNHKDDTTHRSTQNSYVEIKSRNKKTCYATSKIDFIETKTPEWAKLKQTSFRDPKSKESILRSEQEIIAELFANEQGKEECEWRTRKSGGNNERNHDTYNIWETICAGTALPKKCAEGDGSNKVTTETAYLSGCFYLQIINTLKNGKGVVSLFMTWLGMSRNETRHSFLQKIFQSYIDRKHPGFKFPEQGEWKYEILGDMQMDCFKFGAAPVVHSQTQIPEGVHVNLGCDIVWLIVGSALYTSQWTKREAIFNSRNVYSATANLLTIWLHTSTNKAILPPTANMKITLPSVNPDPKKSNLCCSIVYDPRVHCDSFEEDEYDPNSVLAKNMRTIDDFCVINIKGDKALYYDRIIQASDTAIMIDDVSKLFNGPPEAYAHIQPYLKFLKIALHRLHSEAWKDENLIGIYWQKEDGRIFGEDVICLDDDNLIGLLSEQKSPCVISKYEVGEIDLTTLSNNQYCYVKIGDDFWRPVKIDTCFEAIAMKLMGKSMTSDIIRHIPIQLTHCCIKDEREIPAVTFINGYIFVLQVKEKEVVIKPVSKTHETSPRYLFGELDFSELPVEEKYIHGSEVHFFMNLGIHVERSQCVKIIRPCNYTDTRNKVGYTDPAWFFSVIHWPVLVQVHSGDKLMQVTKVLRVNKEYYLSKPPSHLTIVNAKEIYKRMVRTKTVKLADEDWFQSNKGVVRPVRGELKIVTSSGDGDDLMAQFWILIEDSDKNTEYHFFNSIEHLKYTMKTNRGECMGMDDYSRWMMRGFLATSLIVTDNQEVKLFKIFDTCSKLTVREVNYTDPQYDLLMRQLIRHKDYMKREGFLRSNEDVKSEWYREVSQLESALDETSVTKTVMLEVELADRTLQKVRPHDLFIDKAPKLGVILPFQEEGKYKGQYMRDGCYLVHFMQSSFENGKIMVRKYSNEMDFIAVSTCSVREGKMMYLTVDKDMRNSLAALDMEVDCEEDCQIPCFYVLHDPVDKTFDSYTVKILLEFSEVEQDIEEQADQDKNKIMMMCKLYRDDGTQRLDTVRDFTLTLSSMFRNTDLMFEEEEELVIWKTE